MDHGWYGSIVQYVLFVTSCDALRWVCLLWVLTPRTSEENKRIENVGNVELRILEGWQGNHFYCCFVLGVWGGIGCVGPSREGGSVKLLKPHCSRSLFLSRYIACIV